jgi:RNA polymerase sigma-70 factor (ECF subfamily)
MATLGSSTLAEEVVQEAYLRLLENDPGAIDNPSNWLAKVTRNLALDQARRQMRERELLLLMPGFSPYEITDDQYATDSTLAQIVSHLLHASDAQVTAIVLLHLVFGFSYDEIADICGRSAATCRQAASRALRKCTNTANRDEAHANTLTVDMYVHAILEVSSAALIDTLTVSPPVSMLGVADSVQSSDAHDSSACGRTRQVLVLTTTGVQWALVLEGRVLCVLPCAASCSASTAELMNCL